jgi:hypothetical protein
MKIDEIVPTCRFQEVEKKNNNFWNIFYLFFVRFLRAIHVQGDNEPNGIENATHNTLGT